MNINLKDREIRNIIIIFSISILYQITLVIYRELTKKDIKILRENVIFKCNGWCISHFFHYLILGYIAPTYWKELILIGIIFEIIEIPMNKISKYIDSKLIEDSITNSLGIIIGIVLFKMFPNKIDLYHILFK